MIKPLTRNWAILMVIGWTLLIYGWTADNKIALGVAAFIFLVSTVERMENLRIERNQKDRP